MKLFIGCGSSDKVDNTYFIGCRELLNILLKDNDLIFGSYDKGIMNIAYETAISNNRKVIGVLPKIYNCELKMDEKIYVDNIEERTKKMIDLCDAIVFLPGGLGTINEIFSAIDSKRCGEFNKPIVFYNYNHYYDKLFEFLDVLYSEKFSEIEDKKTYYVTDKIDELIKYLNEREG